MEDKVKVCIMGCAAVIVSSVKLEDWQLVEKYAPEMLKIVDEDGNTVFAVRTYSGPGRCIKEEVVWSEAAEPDGKATVTLLIDSDIDDKREAVMETCGSALLDLMEIEKEMSNFLEEIREKQKVIGNCISVIA